MGCRGGRRGSPRAGNGPQRAVTCSPSHLSGISDMPHPPQTQKRDGEYSTAREQKYKVRRTALAVAACNTVSISYSVPAYEMPIGT